MKKLFAVGLVVGCSVFAGACSDDSEDSEKSQGVGGHCTTEDQCFEVKIPADYDISFECSLAKGTLGEGPCDKSKYEVACTEVAQVTVDDEPEQDVTYVYYRAADSEFFCAGEETDL